MFKKYSFLFFILCAGFSVSKLLNFEMLHSFIRVAIFPILIFTYFRKRTNNTPFLLYFLISFTLAELIYIYVFYTETRELLPYIACNVFYVIGYCFIIALIISNLSLKRLLKRFPIQLLILAALGVYLIFELNSVVIKNKETLLFVIGYYIDFIYNLIIIITMCLSLLNYFYHDSRFNLKLLIACVSLIFSEFVQTFYYYQNVPESLHIVIDKAYTILLAISYFTFFLYTISAVKLRK